jgi:hypothetical protein
VRKFISCPETSIVGRTQGELGISQHFACGCGQRRLFILDASDFFFSPSAYRRMLFRSRTGTACACVTKKKIKYINEIPGQRAFVQRKQELTV